MGTIITISAFKYPNTIHYEWQGELLKITPEYVLVLCRPGKQNLRIWVCRDIDGDEMDHLTSENCFEKEYRSLIAIDHSGPKIDDDFYADTIELWYYFGGYFKGKGSLNALSKDEMECRTNFAGVAAGNECL